MNALCLIPPATFPKGLPVSASIRLPATTSDIQFWLVVAPAMQENERFRGHCEVRFRSGDGDFADSDMSGIGSVGEPGAEPGGIAGELPAKLPDQCVMFDFVDRDSPGGGVNIPNGADFVRLTIIPESGNNGGSIWCGAVVVATDKGGNALDFDPSTRGS